MFKKVSIPFLAAICCVFACKKDKKQPLPRTLEIETRSATVHARGGVTLEGKILNSDLARVYGFFYSTDSTFDLFSGNYDFAYVSEPYRDGVYKLDINKGLYKDSVYYFRAYALRDDNSTDLFGALGSFVSTGSSPLSVDSISLKKAYERDLIKVYGKNFYQESVDVYFSGRIAYPSRVLSDSVIECWVPEGLGAGEHFVKVKATGTEDSIGGFSLYTPRVFSFTETATFSDSIVIKGEHFDDNNLYNRVTIGNTSLTITSSARNKIVAYIPTNLEKSRDKLIVHTQSQKATGDKDFQLLRPVIESVTSPVRAGQGLTIKGKYFHPERFNNEVYFDGIAGLHQSYGSAQEVNVMVPDGPYADRKVKMTVKVLDMTIDYPVELNVVNKFFLRSKQVPFVYNAHPGAFTAGNKGYAMTIDYSNGAGTIWSLDPVNYSWSGKPVPASVQLSSQPTVTGAGNKGYLYTGAADNSFYEYTPETNVWTRKADFPGLHRGEAISFSIGNKVYVGGGYYYNDFYAYDPALNTWSKVPDFDFQINIAKPGVMVTVMNNRAYVFAGVNNFRYDPGVNAWTRLADLPQPAGGARMSFALNNKIYLTDTDGYLWAWDSFSNAFVQQEAFSIRTGILYSFVLNGKVYAGGGGSFVNADPPFVSDARLYEWDYTAYP